MSGSIRGRGLPAVAVAIALALGALLPATASAQGTPAELLRKARTWGYQLSALDPARLAGTTTDVLVIDYSRDGSSATELTAAELERLKRKPDGSRRIVLSYLSIGEGESYRFYWNQWWSDLWIIPNPLGPSWRGKLNREWGGNYAVRYWDPAWQAIILGDGAGRGYLDRILAAGFDGVWLDKVDSSIEDVASANPNAKADMIAFIGRIAAKGRAARPGFLVVPQNGEELLPDAGYRVLIDGIGKEDLLFGEDTQGRANKPAVIERRTAQLKLLTAENKPVLAVEYVTDAGQIEAARRELSARGFVPLIAQRDLNVLPGETTPVRAAMRKSRGDDGGGGGRDPRLTWLLVAGAAAVVLIGLFRRRR